MRRLCQTNLKWVTYDQLNLLVDVVLFQTNVIALGELWRPKTPFQRHFLDLNHINGSTNKWLANIGTTNQQQTNICSTNQQQTNICSTNQQQTNIGTTNQQQTNIGTTNQQQTNIGTTDKQHTDIRTTINQQCSEINPSGRYCLNSTYNAGKLKTNFFAVVYWSLKVTATDDLEQPQAWKSR